HMVPRFTFGIIATMIKNAKRGTMCCVWMCLFMALLPAVVRGQTYMEVFGENRLQFRKFDWKYFDTRHFRVYHYDRAGRQLGRYVAEDAENSIPIIEKKLGGQFPHRFNIILYNSYD